jgi:hypothetical protein
MTRPSLWTSDHADYLLQLMHNPDLSTQDMARHMSQQFRVRITPRHVTSLLVRMRNPTDELHRPNTPYLRAGAKFMPWG